MDPAVGTAIAQPASFDWLWWLCLVVLIGLFVTLIYVVYWLGKLPGETARRRGHPQASAVSACGWLGLLFPPLWPIALIWAYLVPAGRELQPRPDLSSLGEAVRAMTARVAEIEQTLGTAEAR